MSPDSPAGKAAAELERRIRAMGTGDGDPDPHYLAQRYWADMMARGCRFTEAHARPEVDPFMRRQGTENASKYAAEIRASLPKPDGAE